MEVIDKEEQVLLGVSRTSLTLIIKLAKPNDPSKVPKTNARSLKTRQKQNPKPRSSPPSNPAAVARNDRQLEVAASSDGVTRRVNEASN